MQSIGGILPICLFLHSVDTHLLHNRASACISIPDQCEIIGFDGIEVSDVFDPCISTVRQPIDEMAEEAVKLLIGIVTGTISSNRHIIFEPTLDLRKTTK